MSTERASPSEPRSSRHRPRAGAPHTRAASPPSSSRRRSGSPAMGPPRRRGTIDPRCDGALPHCARAADSSRPAPRGCGTEDSRLRRGGTQDRAERRHPARRHGRAPSGRERAHRRGAGRWPGDTAPPPLRAPAAARPSRPGSGGRRRPRGRARTGPAQATDRAPRSADTAGDPAARARRSVRTRPHRSTPDPADIRRRPIVPVAHRRHSAVPPGGRAGPPGTGLPRTAVLRVTRKTRRVAGSPRTP